MIRLAFVLLLFTLTASAQTNLPVKASLTVSEVPGRTLHYDMSPSGVEQTVYLEVLERHVVTYRIKDKTLSATNDISTDKVIVRQMLRVGSEWIEKPKTQ